MAAWQEAKEALQAKNSFRQTEQGCSVSATEPLRAQKRALRKTLLAKRDAFCVADQKAAAACLEESLLQHPLFLEADVVLGFYSYGSEVDTLPVLRKALSLGKTLYLPKIVTGAAKEKTMVFFQVPDEEALAQLSPDYKRIPAPKGDTQPFVFDKEKRHFLLLPGVAFDEQGNRLGYGGGFYDRFLETHPALQAKSVGVCHKTLQQAAIPCEATDVAAAQVLFV